MPLPDSIQWKLFRSQTHFQEVVSEIQQYVKSNPAALVREPGGDPNKFIGTFRPKGPLPGRFAIIMGDCIQNLRSSLDYLVWELVLAAKATPGRHNMFPICSTAESFKQQLQQRRRLDGVSAEAVAEIEAMQPYHHGKDFDKTIIWVLDDLCNTNKHRRVLLADLACGPSDLELQVIDGELFGQFTKVERNIKIGPYPMVDGPRGRGPKIDPNPKLTAYIAVSDGTVQDIEISLLLSHMCRYVAEGVLPRFERFF